MKYACLALLALPMWGSTILTCQCTGPNATAVITAGSLMASAGAGMNNPLATTFEQDSANAELDWTDTLTITGGVGSATATFQSTTLWTSGSMGHGGVAWTLPAPTAFTFGAPFTVSGAFFAGASCCDFTTGASHYLNPLFLNVQINQPGIFSGTVSDPLIHFNFFDDPAVNAAVPEPGTWGMLLIGATLPFLRRWLLRT